MANRVQQKKQSSISIEQRRMRRNQIIFASISIIMILSMVLALLAK